MSGAFLRKALSAVFALIILMTAVLSMSDAAKAEPEDRSVTVTLHAGEQGFFGEGEIHDLESVQFFGGVFTEKRVPEAVDPAMMFAGWATESGAEKANVFSGKTSIGQVGTELFAVWTDDCTVRYLAEGGLIETGAENVEEYELTVEPGTAFQLLNAVSADPDVFDFDGWYEILPEGILRDVDQDTLINGPETVVHARWIRSAERAEQIIIGQAREIATEEGPVVFAFTPDETTFYLIRTQDTEAGAACIEVKDGYELGVAEKRAEDDESDASLCTELKAGETYFLFFSDRDGYELFTTAVIEKAECVQVTFHANRGQNQDAWFDGNPETVVKTKDIAIGEDLSDYGSFGLACEDQSVEFYGWAADPDASKAEKLIVEDALDVYAVYRSLQMLTLDANGGAFDENGAVKTYALRYAAGALFENLPEPIHDDNLVQFAGWSRDRNAEKPDEDIVESMTRCEDLPEEVFAVYTEKILITFDANGGYMEDDFNEQSLRVTTGQGHVFSGVSVKHDDPQKSLLGWIDEEEVFIPATGISEVPYRFEKDMVFTAVWGHTVCIDANGGSFGEAGLKVLSILLADEQPLEMETLREEIDNLTHEDPCKIFMGWAQTADAEGPDVYEGETLVKDLDTVYAVWQDDIYYFEEGDGASYEQQTENGLRFSVRRELDDSRTFEAFSTAFLDGKALPSRAYTVHEGGLILILDSAYLDELDPGEHELRLLFNDREIAAHFTVLEHQEESSEEQTQETEDETTEAPTEEWTEPTEPPETTVPIDTSSIENRRVGPFWVTLLAALIIGLLFYYKAKKRGEPVDVYVAPPQKDPQTIASQLAVDAGLMSPVAQAQIEETVGEKTSATDEKATNTDENTADQFMRVEEPAQGTADNTENVPEETKE